MAQSIFQEGRELADASGRMGSIIQTINGIETNIVKIHGETAAIWQGKAAKQNERAFESLRKLTEEYLKDAALTKTALDEAVEAYERTERTQVTKVSQLDTKNIF